MIRSGEMFVLKIFIEKWKLVYNQQVYLLVVHDV